MTGDQYLAELLARITALTGPYGPGDRTREELRPTIMQWAGTQLAALTVSGSYAKGTAIVGGTDVDLFISLKQDTTNTLKEIFDSLASHLQQVGYTARKQNVSIGITHKGLKVDLVPGKRQNSWTEDHSLWVSRQSTWQKTNVSTHIDNARRSGCTDVIRLMKRWRQVNGVDMPSFALELAVIKALDGTYLYGLASKVNHVLEFLRDRMRVVALPDPANASNNVADELTLAERVAISNQAGASRAQLYWNQIIW